MVPGGGNSNQFIEALLLRLVPYRDADAVVTMITPSAGVVSAMARGAKKSRKRFGAALDFFQLIRAELKPSRSSMPALVSVELVHPFTKVRDDIDAYFAASHLLEVTRMGTREGDPSPEPFELLIAAMIALERGGDPLSVVRAFQVRTLVMLGYSISASECAGCGEKLGEGSVRMKGWAQHCGRCAGITGRELGAGAAKTLRAAASAPLGKLRFSARLDEELGSLIEAALVEALGAEPRSLGKYGA